MKKETTEEITLHSIETFNKLVLSFIPSGTLINEFLNFRSSLKQKRLLNFTENVKRILSEISRKDINPNNFTSEEFIDVFDEIINKIQLTKSETKLQYYSNLLVHQMTRDSANDIISNKIIQTVDELNELQLLLLMIVYDHDYPTIYNIHLGFQMKRVYIRLDERDDLPEGINQGEVLEPKIFLYFLDELISKGLILSNEMDGEVKAPLQELEMAYKLYIDKNRSFSNTHIIYSLSSYGTLFCDFVKYH